jgi:mannose-1-phosphate guanylyltransferase
MVLGAGFGQRLRPLTVELPKPLMPVGDKPVLAHIAEHIARAGHARAVINSHWQPASLQAAAERLPLEMQVVHEPTIRGVAGGVAGARRWLEAPLVVWNGDVLLTHPPFVALSAAVAASGGICLAVAATTGPGVVGLDDDGCLVRVRGEVYGRETQGADYVGMFGLGERALSELPLEGCIFGEYIMPLLRRGERVPTRWIEGHWRDIGNVESYWLANREWLRLHANHPSGSFVAPGAQLAPSVALASSIIGAGARVGGAGSLEGCVVWPQSMVDAPLHDAIVTPLRTVPIHRAGTP